MGVTEFQLRIDAKCAITPDIWEFRLIASDGRALPAVAPGAHLTLATPAQARRRYSIIQACDTPAAYTIAVQRESNGRGGSSSLVDQTQCGDLIYAQPPENSFPLYDSAEYLFIAGGIGITPILPMIRALRERGQQRYRLIYLTRDAAHTAYLEELSQPAAGAAVIIHHDNGNADHFYDLWPILEDPGERSLYYCGPAALMEEIDAMTGHWPIGQIHFESFAPTVLAVQADDSEFKIICQRSGLTVNVASDQSALTALRNAGVNVSSSCESGTCGSCRTRLLAGDVLHRDQVLRTDEQNSHIMLCVSRARDEAITIDL